MKRENLYILGDGYNHLLPKPGFFDSPRPFFLDQINDEEINQRAEHLIASDNLDALEVDLYKSGDIDYCVLYQIAKEQARKDICDEIESRGCCDNF